MIHLDYRAQETGEAMRDKISHGNKTSSLRHVKNEGIPLKYKAKRSETATKYHRFPASKANLMH